MLEEFIGISKGTEINKFLPSAYFDSSLDVIPLRIVWSQNHGEGARRRLSSFIDVSWTWFLKPVVATREPLQHFKYIKSSCPVSEGVGVNMVNLPLSISANDKLYLDRAVETVIG